ncbi:MAG: 8-oxo-dGTP diphosphatase [Patescibacteria group bacterium]|nr:8-oxo-dGTP diphosphatase [Patescibacteria group bacterium]
MKNLVTINLENVPSDVAATFKTRTAARAVILDSEGNIAMLAVTKDGYHKLPGGGVDEGEDLSTALARECMEEVGCEIRVLEEIGTVLEIRKNFCLVQDSHAWLAKLEGEKGTPDFTESELSRGFEIRWMPITEAKRLLNEERSDDYESQYIVIRDLAILEEAERLITGRN